MFAAHMGVGLALGRAERRVNAGVFIAAGLLLDMLLWLFVLLLDALVHRPEMPLIGADSAKVGLVSPPRGADR